MKKLLLSILGIVLFHSVFAQFQEYKKELYTSKTGVLPYRILYPIDFDSTKTYPIVWFLHGVGERGNDNEIQLSHGGELFLKAQNRKDFPAIVIFPQCPITSFWSNAIRTNAQQNQLQFVFQNNKVAATPAMTMLLSLMDHINHQKYVNKDRIYIGGLSMGGMGTYEVLRRKPKTFAAAFAICGGDLVSNVKKYGKNQAIWVFHGELDKVVSPKLTHAIADELKRLGAHYKATFYPNDDHNSWDSAFAEPDLLKWLFSNHK